MNFKDPHLAKQRIEADDNDDDEHNATAVIAIVKADKRRPKLMK